jgi:hypothetical protein
MSKKAKNRNRKVKGKIKKAVENVKPEAICGNCLLYDPKRGECRVVVLHEGEKYNIPVVPQDSCFFEDKFTAVEKVYDDEKLVGTRVESFVPAEEIKQARFWVEDPETGKPTSGDGIVKMEYPEGFFGDEKEKKVSKRKK